MGFWGRNKGVAIKSAPDGLKDIFGMLTGRGDIATNTAEALRTLKRSEAAGHLLFDFQHRRDAHGLMHQVVKNLRRPLHWYVMLIGKIRRPCLDGRAVLHRLRHTGRKIPFVLRATRRTYRDFGTMGRDFNADGRNIEHLAFFITRGRFRDSSIS